MDNLVEIVENQSKVICCVDMFPNTYHVETIVALHRIDL